MKQTRKKIHMLCALFIVLFQASRAAGMDGEMSKSVKTIDVRTKNIGDVGFALSHAFQLPVCVEQAKWADWEGETDDEKKVLAAKRAAGFELVATNITLSGVLNSFIEKYSDYTWTYDSTNDVVNLYPKRNSSADWIIPRLCFTHQSAETLFVSNDALGLRTRGIDFLGGRGNLSWSLSNTVTVVEQNVCARQALNQICRQLPQPRFWILRKGHRLIPDATGKKISSYLSFGSYKEDIPPGFKFESAKSDPPIGTVLGTPVPVLNIEDIAENADTIAVVQPLGVGEPVRVLTVVKGDRVAVGNHIKIRTTDELVCRLRHTQGPVYVFLKADASNTFQIANSFYPFFRVAPERLSAIGKVSAERELICGLQSKDQTVVSDAVEWLVQMNSREGMQEINSLYEKGCQSLAVQAAALQLQVPNGGKDVLAKAVDLVSQTTNEPTRWRLDLTWSFSKIVKTDSVAFLNKLLISGPGKVSKALCFSSVNWADKTSIPYLTRAMTSMDLDGKYRCIITLSALTGRKAPDYDRFMSNPAKYVSEWEK